MSVVLPFECEHESKCATNGKDQACANKDACHMPTCSVCGTEMIAKVMERDSALLPGELRWMRYACPVCEEES